jgi:hypothetical protein
MQTLETEAVSIFFSVSRLVSANRQVASALRASTTHKPPGLYGAPYRLLFRPAARADAEQIETMMNKAAADVARTRRGLVPFMNYELRKY